MCLHFMQRCNSAPNLFVLFVSYKIKTNSTSTISKYYNLPQTSMLLIEIWVLLILFIFELARVLLPTFMMLLCEMCY